MGVNKKKGVIVAVLFSFILHALFLLAFYYLFRKKPLFPSKLPPIPKQTVVDIVTLPEQTQKTRKEIKEKHKVGSNVSRKGMARVYSKKEQLPFGFGSKPLISVEKPFPPKIVIKKTPTELERKSKKKQATKKTKKEHTKPLKLAKKGVLRKKAKSAYKITGKVRKRLGEAKKKLVKTEKKQSKGAREKVIKLSGNLFKPYNLKPGFLSGRALKYEYKRAKREATISIGTQSIKYASYLEHIKNKIENVWAYPAEAARTGQQGTLLILFSINKNGDLIRLKLIRSSGYPLLDRAALEAVRDASPFPPLPKRFNLDVLNIYATFEYDLGFRYVY